MSTTVDTVLPSPVTRDVEDPVASLERASDLDNPLRVLHVVSHFPPDRIGGVGEVTAHLHRGLLAAGHDSTVLTTGTSHDDPRVRRIASSPGAFGAASMRWLNRARDHDVVHAQHGEALPLLAGLRARRNRPALLMTMHVDNRMIRAANAPFLANGQLVRGDRSARLQHQIRSPLKAAMDAAALRMVDQVSFISRRGALEVLGEHGAAAPVIYNGVAPRDQGSNAPLGRSPESAELLYVGTPGVRKRTALLPQILAGVRASLPGARLRIAGFSLVDQPALRAEFERLGLLSAVICEGQVASTDLAPFYRAAQVLVVPSAYEGLPMVVMEAAREGLTTVATDVGGVAELVRDGVTGRLVPPDDVQALVAATVSLLGDHAGRQAMGTAVQTLVAQRFGVDRQVREYVDLYRSLQRASRSVPSTMVGASRRG